MTRSDVLDALEYARNQSVFVKPDPRKSNEENFKHIMQTVDDACHERLKKHTFVLCDCCTHGP